MRSGTVFPFGCDNSIAGERATPDPRRCLRITLGKIGPYLFEVRNGCVRPDYLEVHAVAQDSSRRSASS